MNTHKLTPLERRAILGISTLMGLRMIGLFMVLPVFSLYASGLAGATATLVGVALGIYGLSQALLQIPFGALSDRFGRKRIILIGLILFIVGSLIAGIADNITLMIIGRALQGAGAIGGTTLAMMADLTRDNQRTKAMAIAGMTIGASFSLAMLLGPILTAWVPVSGLFFIAAMLGLVAITLLYTRIPTPVATHWHRDTEPERRGFLFLLFSPQLLILNLGIFLLHAIFSATFIALPFSLNRFLGLGEHQQWLMYLPALLVAFLFTLIGITLAERKQQHKTYFIGSVLLLLLAELILWQAPDQLFFTLLGVGLFFTGFSMLEAFLPSLVSRAAPPSKKGSVLGLFSCSQFFGIFVGGVLGGFLYGKNSFSGVYLFCVILIIVWFALALCMKPPAALHQAAPTRNE